MAMTTRQNTKTITVPSATMASATEESVPERVTQRKPEGGRFRLQVDRQQDAPDFVEVGEAAVAVSDTMRHQRRVQLVG